MDAQSYRKLRAVMVRNWEDWFGKGLPVVRILTTYLLVSGNRKLV